MGNQISLLSRNDILDQFNITSLPPLNDNTINELSKQYSFTSKEIQFAYYSHAIIQTIITSSSDWILSRAIQLLCGKNTSITLNQYLSMIQWWHKSPYTAKLQYIFHFLDVNDDDMITIDDLLIVLPRLLGTKLQIGDKIYVKKTGICGTIKYIGPVPELGGKVGDWCGIEYTGGPYGNSNGTYKDKSYFTSKPMYGDMIRIEQCELTIVYDWINSIFINLIGQVCIKYNDNNMTITIMSLSIQWDQFAEATVHDSIIQQRLINSVFPFSL